MPEDLTDLSPEEQRRRILMRSAVKLSLGFCVACLCVFSGPWEFVYLCVVCGTESDFSSCFMRWW